MAYFGPPAQALRYFDRPDFADLFLLLEREHDIDWGERFRRSQQFARYIAEPAARADHSRQPRPWERPHRRPRHGSSRRRCNSRSCANATSR
jgi:hypothetical protein